MNLNALPFFCLILDMVVLFELWKVRASLTAYSMMDYLLLIFFVPAFDIFYHNSIHFIRLLTNKISVRGEVVKKKEG